MEWLVLMLIIIGIFKEIIFPWADSQYWIMIMEECEMKSEDQRRKIDKLKRKCDGVQ